MAIHRFFTKDIVIRRLSTVSGYKKSFQSTATVEGHIQEMSRQTRERLGIVEERAWYAWFDINEDVREGDILMDEYGTEYRVTEVTKKDYGTNEHRQVIMQEANE